MYEGQYGEFICGYWGLKGQWIRGLLLFLPPPLALLNILWLITRFFPMLAVGMDRFHFLQWLIEYTNWVRLVTCIYCYHIA